MNNRLLYIQEFIDCTLRGQKCTVREKFWSKVNKTDSCWVWIGAIGKSGYGNFVVKEMTFSAHVFSWLLAYNEVPTKMVLHKLGCNNKKCVNPNHLYLGSRSQNAIDYWRSGKDPLTAFLDRRFAHAEGDD